MDEILLANFMSCTTCSKRSLRPRDRDEAWETDYYLHENPELKRTAFGLAHRLRGLAVHGSGSGFREARLTADYNARCSSRSHASPGSGPPLFVGSRDDVVDAPRTGASGHREWTSAHYDFQATSCPSTRRVRDRDGLRARLGFRPDERVVFARWAGPGRPAPVAEGRGGLPQMRRRVPESPADRGHRARIDPAGLPPDAGVEYRRFVPDLYAHLAGVTSPSCRAALSTCMELTATRRPLPLLSAADHFEQSITCRIGRSLRRGRAHGLRGAIRRRSLTRAEGSSVRWTYRDVRPGGPPGRRADRPAARRRTAMKRAPELERDQAPERSGPSTTWSRRSGRARLTSKVGWPTRRPRCKLFPRFLPGP